MKALVLAPYDGTAVLERANTLAKAMAEALLQENYAVDLLDGAECTRKNLPPGPYEFILLVGHGTAQTFQDSNDRVLFDDSNMDYFRNAMVVAISCETGRWLGLTAVTKGAKAYIGFTENLVIPSRTEDHNYAGDFMRTLMTIVLALLEGYTIQQTTEEFKLACLQYAAKYEDRKRDHASDVMYAWMQSNANAVTYAGHPATYIGDEALVVKVE